MIEARQWRALLEDMREGEPASQLEVKVIGSEEHNFMALMSKTEVLLAVEVDARRLPRSAPSLLSRGGQCGSIVRDCR